MELNGCARCQATNGVCTYSLGKWMGRPKKSGQQVSLFKAREAEGARSASLELERDRFDQITDTPNEKHCWELASFVVNDPMEFCDNTAISPFSIDDYHQPGAESHYSSTNGGLGRASSMEEMGSRATPQTSNSGRETEQCDIQTANNSLYANTKSNKRFSRRNISAETMVNIQAARICVGRLLRPQAVRTSTLTA
ncbi:zn2 cys6 dna-binding protein [Stemphylium lycopersici]|nr:zn2 cys6 dna-binding protein [Stemphylium lycopersici]